MPGLNRATLNRAVKNKTSVLQKLNGLLGQMESINPWLFCQLEKNEDLQEMRKRRTRTVDLNFQFVLNAKERLH